jgi:hypothetical protein
MDGEGLNSRQAGCAETPEKSAQVRNDSLRMAWIRNAKSACGKVFLQPYQGITDFRSLSWALRHHWFRSAAQSG